MASGNWIQHTLDRSRWRPQKQVVALATLGLFVAIIIGALYLSQSAETSTLGRQLEDLITERNDLEQANEQLRAEIASYQSMPRLQRRAEELGFVPATAENIHYLVIDGYDPEHTAPVVVVDAESDPVPVYDESFTGWVAQQWDSFREQIEKFTSEQEAG
jgi:hypothetical protein